MRSESQVTRARAHGGTPVLPSAFGCQGIFGSEQRATVLCRHTTCKETTDRDRLPHQQPVHFQKKEKTNREANNFYLKSCPANWVHLNLLPDDEAYFSTQTIILIFEGVPRLLSGLALTFF